MWSSGSDGSEQKAVLILCVPSSAFSVVNESKLFLIYAFHYILFLFTMNKLHTCIY